ncbi:hypothetical protein Aperf_G00000091397 [Anoplocephala perfoliata]
MLWYRRRINLSQDFGVAAVGIILLPTVLVNPGFIMSDARKMHLVYWNTSNPLFRANTPKDLRVSIDDQIAFICPNRVPPTNKVYWTTDVNFYKTCQQPIDHLSLIHLLVDCFQKPPAYHLLIDISVLINQLPPADVQDQTSIYFMADTALCKLKNMHMNVTVVIPERRHSIPEGRNIALADSANVIPEDTLHVPSPKPILTDFGMSVNPRSSRFIGLLVAYVLITLLVVYMVVCAVCFQPRKCLNLINRDTDGEGTNSVPLPPPSAATTPPPRSSRFGRTRRSPWRWFRPRNTTGQNSDVPLVLPRTNPHFSRSVNGERFLHYPIHFHPESAATNTEEDDWGLHQSRHHQHHLELQQQHRRPVPMNVTWNSRMDEASCSPLPAIGAPMLHYTH